MNATDIYAMVELTSDPIPGAWLKVEGRRGLEDDATVVLGLGQVVAVESEQVLLSLPQGELADLLGQHLSVPRVNSPEWNYPEDIIPVEEIQARA